MKQTRFRTVQSFLIWLEEQTKKKLYIKAYTDGSGEIGDAKDNQALFTFEASRAIPIPQ